MFISFTTKQFLFSTIYIGHKRKQRNPELNYYLNFVRNEIDFFDMQKILTSFKEVRYLLMHLGFLRRTFLAVCQNTSCFVRMRSLARKKRFNFICNRWWGGTLTNYKQIKKSIFGYNYLKTISFKKKKLQLSSRKVHFFLWHVLKNKNYFVGLRTLYSLPDFIYSATVSLDRFVIQEANCLDIPVAGLTDSNASKNGITYVIPGNDEAVESIFFVLKFLLKNFHTGFFLRLTLFFFRYFKIIKRRFMVLRKHVKFFKKYKKALLKKKNEILKYKKLKSFIVKDNKCLLSIYKKTKKSEFKLRASEKLKKNRKLLKKINIFISDLRLKKIIRPKLPKKMKRLKMISVSSFSPNKKNFSIVKYLKFKNIGKYKLYKIIPKSWSKNQSNYYNRNRNNFNQRNHGQKSMDFVKKYQNKFFNKKI